MGKSEHRVASERRDHRYPSVLADAEWALVEPLIPPAKHGGRHREVNVREKEGREAGRAVADERT